MFSLFDVDGIFSPRIVVVGWITPTVCAIAQVRYMKWIKVPRHGHPHTRMCNPIRESESQSLHKRNPIFISRYFVFLLCMNRSGTQLAQAFDVLDMEGTRD